ncbi:YaiO family outer membrane beta-barrel protein [Halomonas chromatireducens]|uniref:YaiO beta-barrel domain-containing protein n=1 Tax=Halomonas chromatireducens TaxID=507626 RepID=A0A0X8HD33_9GAMM|nr:YaiO family outer membrane beta-barrel protein [Halomonas chromatireducens]AMD00407.1 hypothetical protein LOKO_01339 [Halomonas chromatireducens]
MRRRCFCQGCGWLVGSWLAASLSAAPAFAEERRTEVEISQRYEWVDSGFADWQAQRLDWQTGQPGAITWYGAALRERRYALWDQGVELGAAVPLGDDWVLQPEVGSAFSPDFLPDWYADLRLQRRLTAGFVGSTSLRHTEYVDSRVDRLALGIERYWGAWRMAYTLNVSDVQGAGTPVGHAVALDHYYGERSVVGLRAGLGREEEVVRDGEVTVSSVAAFAVRGRHWFHPEWAINWELGALSQGDIHDRYGMQLGLRHAF